MAYDFQAGTHQILYGSPSYLDGMGPVTYAAWMQRDAAGGGGFGRLYSKDEKKIASTILLTGGGQFADTVNCSVATSSTPHNKSTALNSIPNAATTWVHLCFAWDGTLTTGGSDLYKDGAKSTPYAVDVAGSGSITSDAAGDFAIGNRSSGVLDRGFDGRIAEFALWNAKLTDAEVNSLGKGFRPTRVRPQSLVFYVRLIRTANEIRNGTAATVSGVAPAGYHPRVY
jgi:hypothetical protein